MENKNKKPDRNDNEDPDIEELIEELKQQLQEQTGNKKVEIVRLSSQPVTLLSRLYFLLISLLVNSLLITSLSGLIKWAEGPILSFIFLIVVFTLIEELLKYLANLFIPAKYILMTFGIIMIIPAFISFLITVNIVPNLSLIGSSATIVFLYGLIIIRGFVNRMITKNRLRRRVNRARNIKR